MIVWLTIGIALILSLLFIPFVRIYCFRFGLIAKPRPDRWHQKPTPMMGGIAIFLSFAISITLAGLFLAAEAKSRQSAGLGAAPAWYLPFQQWSFLAGSIFIFGLGLYDDIKHISPPAKLIGQVIATTIVVLLGYTTNFFTPKLANNLIAAPLNILLTFIWLVGITNAINLLDNMDGLAGSISLITAALLGFLFWRAGNMSLVLVSAALMGSLIGFLFFNLPPAKIFMGDSGSMFIGFTLAVLAIARQPQASNVFAVLGVPTLLFLLPILDVILVTFTRMMRGVSLVQGGRDHTSHRLIAFGLNERQVVWIFSGLALLSGVVAIAIESVGYWLSLIFVPILVAGLALVIAYLGGMKITDPLSSASSTQLGKANDMLDDDGLTRLSSHVTNPFVRVMLNLTFKRRLLEMILDFVIILLAFYLAFITRYGLFLSEIRLMLFIQALPVALSVSYLSFFLTGVYRSVWRYIGVDDFVRYFKAAASSMLFVGGVVYLLYYLRVTQGIRTIYTAADPLPPVTIAYSPSLFILFAVFLFLGLATSRSSFRVLDRLFGQQMRTNEERILIYGAGDAGEMALRWILMNPNFNYKPVGFVDDDALKTGRTIHGVVVLGVGDQLEEIIERLQAELNPIDGLIVSQAVLPAKNLGVGLNSRDDSALRKVRSVAKRHGCWVRNFHLEFELLE